MIATTHLGTHEGQRVLETLLTSSSGVEIAIMNYGGVVRDWRVPVGDKHRSVVLGFKDFQPYPEHSPHFGAIVGRVANRISRAKFDLGGTSYNLATDAKGLHLHGGPEGLSSRIWNMEADSAANCVRLTHFSPDGAMGYPGEIMFEATYTLVENKLRLDLSAKPSELTPISLAQHNYFNLTGGVSVLDHTVTLAGSMFTPLDNNLFPTGEILPVDNTIFDFRCGRTLVDAAGRGIDYDVNFELDKIRDHTQRVAKVDIPDQSLTLRLCTDRPGLQFYNGVTTQVAVPGLGGRIYGKHSGLCLEDQMFPDAVSHPNFPLILCGPDRPYSHWCEFEIS